MAKKAGRIRDVAAATGLSVATISRVMNGAQNVREETRAIVKAASEKLDYLPNSAARALTTKRSKTIAAIIPTIEHSVFAKYIDAIEKTLAARGYSLVLAISNGNEEEELDAARKLLGMGADAFILSGLAHHEELLGILDRRELPYAFTSVWNPDSDRPTIGYDNSRLASEAMKFLWGKGHRRIAILHGPLHNSDRTLFRKQGAQASADLFEVLDFFETELSVEGGKAAVSSILSSAPDYTAILCFSDVLALGAYFALQEAGLSVPSSISVMGFDNLEWSTQVVPALTTIDLPTTEMGVSVATELMNHLESGKTVSSIEVYGRIVERQSVADLT